MYPSHYLRLLRADWEPAPEEAEVEEELNSSSSSDMEEAGVCSPSATVVPAAEDVSSPAGVLRRLDDGFLLWTFEPSNPE